MKAINFKTLAMMVCTMLMLPLAAMAQTDTEPIIEFKTAIHEQDGEEAGRTVTILLGRHNQEKDYIDLD